MTTATFTDWNDLIAESEYDALAAIRDAVRVGNLEEAEAGILEFMEIVAKKQRNAVRSHLKQLMAHVLKWKIQPNHRSRSWATTIINSRDEIEDLQEESPSITNEDIYRELWDDAFLRAKRLAAVDTGLKVTVSDLTWKEVFEDEYFLPDE
ncbi:MAG: DUF29 domain-containing protein [Planctomycetaceae bacterium]